MPPAWPSHGLPGPRCRGCRSGRPRPRAGPRGGHSGPRAPAPWATPPAGAAEAGESAWGRGRGADPGTAPPARVSPCGATRPALQLGDVRGDTRCVPRFCFSFFLLLLEGRGRARPPRAGAGTLPGRGRPAAGAGWALRPRPPRGSPLRPRCVRGVGSLRSWAHPPRLQGADGALRSVLLQSPG